MDDEHLRHLCKLASVAVGGLRDRDDWMEFIRDADSAELRNHHTCLSILSEAFIELMDRCGMKPSFHVPAGTAPALLPQDGKVE